MEARLAAARIVQRVREGGSLDREIARLFEKQEVDSPAAAQALAYGVLRHRELIDAVIGKLLRKGMKPKDQIVHELLAVAVFEMLSEETPDYAVINSAVNQVKKQRKWAAGMVNASLRRFRREHDELLASAAEKPSVRHLLPNWLLKQLQQDWPEQWEDIAAGSSKSPPMTLRVNRNASTSADYLKRMEAAELPATQHPQVACAVVPVAPCGVEMLPGFAEGDVTVQDASAQLAALLMMAEPEQNILDACAAPGGKTTHLCEETGGKARILALELSEARTGRMKENFARSGCEAEIVVADATEIESWWDGKPFDRILLDVPCSATGVIRRHPDIKLHRTPEDLQALAQVQSRILRQVWKTLAPGGIMLYATCSILKAENTDNVGRFLAETPNASEIPIDADWGHVCDHGRQILPGEDDMDGFYYALISRHDAA